MDQTESKSCNKFNSFIVTIKKKLREGRMIESLLEVLRLGCKLFHSIIAGGKKEFLKKLCFFLIRRILPTVLLAYGVLLT